MPPWEADSSAARPANRLERGGVLGRQPRLQRQLAPTKSRRFPEEVLRGWAPWRWSRGWVRSRRRVSPRHPAPSNRVFRYFRAQGLYQRRVSTLAQALARALAQLPTPRGLATMPKRDPRAVRRPVLGLRVRAFRRVVGIPSNNQPKRLLLLLLAPTGQSCRDRGPSTPRSGVADDQAARRTIPVGLGVRRLRDGRPRAPRWAYRWTWRADPT